MNLSRIILSVSLFAAMLSAQTITHSEAEYFDERNRHARAGAIMRGVGTVMEYSLVLPKSMKVMRDYRENEDAMRDDRISESQYNSKQEEIMSSAGGVLFLGMTVGGLELSGDLTSAIAAARASKTYAKVVGDKSRNRFVWGPFIAGMGMGLASSMSSMVGSMDGSKSTEVSPFVMISAIASDVLLTGSAIHAAVITSKIDKEITKIPQKSFSLSVNPIILKNGGGAQVAVRF